MDTQKRDKVLHYISLGIRYAVLILFGATFLFPFYWMVITALRPAGQPLGWPPVFVPQTFHWENFVRVTEIAPFFTYFKNTLIMVFFDLVLTMVIVALAAFGFAHYEFKGKEALFMMVLTTMMIPSESLTITNYLTISRLKWIDTYQALFMPYVAGAFNIYLLREAFMAVPKQLYLAAKVDGCSDFAYFVKILLPVTRPTLITIALLKTIASWNSFLWPLLVTNSRSMRVVSYGLVNFQSEAGSDYVLIMAASILTVAPILLLFLFARKQIIEGIAKGGLKG